jgi:PhnB protein
MPASALPTGYHSVTPYLIVDNGQAAIEFYKKAFGAVEILRLAGPEGQIGHAEIQIGNSRVMLADEHPIMGFVGPITLGGSTVTLLVYVSDVDASYHQAIKAGAKMMKPIQDQFYGDRSGSVVDPFGHVWTLATRKQDLSPEEIKALFQKMIA